MASLLADAAISGEKAQPEKWADIEATVQRFHTHADGEATERQRDYAVIKHIVVNNLYGVDIEEQATEIAELLAWMRQQPTLAHIPAICVTASVPASERERMQAAGFTAFVPKPISPPQRLLDALAEVLGGPARGAPSGVAPLSQ